MGFAIVIRPGWGYFTGLYPRHYHTLGVDVSNEVVNSLARLFIARSDIRAVQRRNGEWFPDRTTDKETGEVLTQHGFDRKSLSDHISGKASYGHYMIDSDNTCKLFAFDIDVVKTARPEISGDVSTWDHYRDGGMYVPGSPRDVFTKNRDSNLGKRIITELRGVAEGLAAATVRLLDLPTAISFSGSKGLHVYCFTGRQPSEVVRELAMEVMRNCPEFQPIRGNNFFRHTNDPRWGYPNVEVEVFPKQESLDGKDLGNLMRLPLGINRKSGEQAFFIRCDVPSDQLVERDAVGALEGRPWPM